MYLIILNHHSMFCFSYLLFHVYLTKYLKNVIGSQKLKAEIQNEEINLSSLNSETKNSGDISTDIETDYPFIKWHWKFIRIVSSLITLFAILSCFGSSVFLIGKLLNACLILNNLDNNFFF